MNGKIIDIHVHFGAPEDRASGCYWSREFEKTPAYWFMKVTSGALFKKMDINLILKKLLKVINGATRVNSCVLLAMDQVYDENGNHKPGDTQLYVPNSYIVGLSRQHERILFGASIHPYRKDWERELEYCIENRACLLKWIPSSQQIDPEHPRCMQLYEKLVEHQLPLLLHCGPEHAIPTSDKNYERYNNPRYIREALEHGVTVIIAHCALPYIEILDKKYMADYREFYRLFEDAEKHTWNLYADLSALTTPFRKRFIPEIIKKIPPNRLLFASDYPIPPSELSYMEARNPFRWMRLFLKAIRIKNPLDKNLYLLRKRGFDERVFTNANRIIFPH